MQKEKLFGQSTLFNVLVYGWYNHNNIGDDLFCEAFKTIFPNINFSFSDNLNINNIKDASAIFIGGGSFLGNSINISNECLNIIKTKKIFYVGVGAETDIHPTHQNLIRLAKLIALRSPVGIEKIQELNEHVIVIPDIVYSLKPGKLNNRKNKSVLVLPNIHAIPQNIDAHWKHISWEHFKFEFSQFLDYLIDDGYMVNFFSMCTHKLHNDDWAAHEIISNMKNRDGNNLIKSNSSDIKDVCKLFSKYETIITQRFHGIILSEITRTPYLSIFHHDKLKTSSLNEGIFTSMYAISKRVLIDQFYLTNQIKLSPTMAIESDMFKNLEVKIISTLLES